MDGLYTENYKHFWNKGNETFKMGLTCARIGIVKILRYEFSPNLGLNVIPITIWTSCFLETNKRILNCVWKWKELQ